MAVSRAQEGCFFISIRAETRRPLFELGWERAMSGDTNISPLPCMSANDCRSTLLTLESQINVSKQVSLQKRNLWTMRITVTDIIISRKCLLLYYSHYFKLLEKDRDQDPALSHPLHSCSWLCRACSRGRDHPQISLCWLSPVSPTHIFSLFSFLLSFLPYLMPYAGMSWALMLKAETVRHRLFPQGIRRSWEGRTPGAV